MIGRSRVERRQRRHSHNSDQGRDAPPRKEET